MHESVDEVFVHHAGFQVAVRPFFHLFHEAFALVDGVIQFRKAIAQLAAVNKAFEAIRDFRVCDAALGQRRNFLGILVDKDRLDQLVFHKGVEEGVDNLADAPCRFDRDFGILRHGAGLLQVRDPVEVVAAVFLDGIDHGDTGPRRRQVDFRALVGDFHRPQDVLRRLADQFFRNVHDRFHVAVSLVQLQRREFRIMFDIHAFVTEDTAQFIYPFHAADDQSLQVQFRGDAQIEFDVQGVVVCNKRPCRGAAGNSVQDRRLDFQKAIFVEDTTDALDDLRPFDKDIFHFGIDDEVHIALPIAQVHVLKAVEFFRQRLQGFGQELQVFDADGRFARMGQEDRARHADDIAEVHQFRDGIDLFAQHVLAQVELDAARLVMEVHEARLAVAADSHDTAGHFDHRVVVLHFLGLGMYFAIVVRHIEAVPEGGDAAFFQFMHLVDAVLDLFVDVEFRSLGFLLFWLVLGILAVLYLGIFCHIASPNYLIFVILYWWSPIGVRTVTTAPVFLPRMAAPMGDSLEIFPANGSASVVPTMMYSWSLSSSNSGARSSMMTVVPSSTCVLRFLELSMTTAVFSICSISWTRPSMRACSSLAASYSEFSLKSPWEMASCRRSSFSRRLTVRSSFNSAFSFSKPSAVKIVCFSVMQNSSL